jgi:uncharacterized SAM-binding protein YcdF (DUF218 family)
MMVFPVRLPLRSLVPLAVRITMVVMMVVVLVVMMVVLMMVVALGVGCISVGLFVFRLEVRRGLVILPHAVVFNLPGDAGKHPEAVPLVVLELSGVHAAVDELKHSLPVAHVLVEFAFIEVPIAVLD